MMLRPQISSTARLVTRVGPRLTGQLVRTLTDDGYLHKSKVPTMAFQDSLLKLKIPSLEDTAERFLASARPLANDAEYAQTKAALEDFMSSEAVDLQKKVVEEDKRVYSSYITAPWNQMYLDNRASLPVNLNPQITMKDDPDPAKHDQGTRAASLIAASVAYYRTLRDNLLTPHIFQAKGKEPTWGDDLFSKVINLTPRKFKSYLAYANGTFPLDMSQYSKLFGLSRIPEIGTDRLQSYSEEQSRHIVIQYGYDFFTLDVLRPDGTGVPEGEIASGLAKILRQPPRLDGPAFGLGTTLGRDEWAVLRKKVMDSSATNAASVDAISSALFAVCLEHESVGAAPMTPLEETTNEQYTDLTEAMLYGKGRNRWFDKSFQLIVAKNAKAAVNFEHSWGDGVAVLRYFNEIYAESAKNAAATPVAGVEPKKLEFDFSDDIVQDLSKAGEGFDALLDSLELLVLQTQVMNADLLKECKLGTDGAMQMAFQLGYYRLYGENASTYESANTAAFKHGRTETVRPCTTASDKFVKLFCDPQASQADREEALRSAITNHGKLTKEGVFGKAWDRHLFALKSMAKREYGSVPAFFEDPVVKKLDHIIISTSTLASEALDAGGFGPVNKDCYGIGYGIINIGARLSVMSYKRDTQQLLDCIEQGMADMLTVASGKNF
eukprot:m.19654 g.19654  ORF g.19654 m.19654 type:complete len:665 (+) comp8060_c0_seq2:89-2083(+)